MDKNTLISLEESLYRYQDCELTEKDFILEHLDYGRESVIGAIGELLKSIADLLMSIITAIKNIIIKVSRYIGFKLSITSTNCRYISSNKNNKNYRRAVDKVIFGSGVSYEKYKSYTSNVLLLVDRLTNLITSSNIYKQISDILDLNRSDSGDYLPPLQLPITQSTYLGMQGLCNNVGLDIVPVNTVIFGDSEIWESCEIKNNHIFSTLKNENMSFSNLGYTLEKVLDIHKNYYTKLYNITPIINDYLDSLTEIKNRINTIVGRGISNSSNANKVIRLKLLSKNIFICAQLYTVITSLIIEPMNYFTEFTTIIKNIQTF